MIGANTASTSHNGDLKILFMLQLPLARQIRLAATDHRPERHNTRRQAPILSRTQRVQSILRLLNSTGMSLGIVLPRLGRIAARSVCPPCGENDGIIGLREREACPCAARVHSARQHYPCRADISL